MSHVMLVRVYIAPLLYLFGTCQRSLSTPTPNSGFEVTNVTQRRRESTTRHPKGGYRRQAPPSPLPAGVTPPRVAPSPLPAGVTPPEVAPSPPPEVNKNYPQDAANAAAHKFKVTRIKRTLRTRTFPPRLSFSEDCDFIAFYCMKVYNTGKLCGRTNAYKYREFQNYCMLDYVNCMERYDAWQVVSMGSCFHVEPQTNYYQHYPYLDDYFLDTYYVMEDQV